MQSVLKEIEQQHANAFQNILEIHMLHVGQNVLQMQNVPQTSHVATRNVLIHALDYVVSMLNVEQEITWDPAPAFLDT